MDFHKDSNQSNGVKKPLDFDFDSFLDTESLEDRLTAALDGRDVLDSTPAEPYVPHYQADPNHGRHETPAPVSTEQHPSENISYDDEFWNAGADPRFIAPQRPKVVVRDPYEQPPVFETNPVGFENKSYPGPQNQHPGQQVPYSGGNGVYPPEGGNYNSGRRKKGPVGIIVAVLGVLAAIMAVVLIASLTKHTGKTEANTSASNTDTVIQGTTIPAKTDSPETDSQAQTTPAKENDPDAVMYTVTAAAGPGGEISPSGTNNVREGESITFTFIADNGCEIADVQVDGESISLDSSGRYTFSDVDSNHTINVTFAAKATATPSPTSAPVISNVTPTPAPTDVPEVTDTPADTATDSPVEVTAAPEAANEEHPNDNLLPPGGTTYDTIAR